MNKSFYDNLSRPYEENGKKRNRLLRTNQLITWIFNIVYPALLVYLLVLRDPRIVKAFFVPVLGFAAVTLFRKLYNAPRPYEVWDESPLIPKESAGKSFPSRHVFSAFIIVQTVAYVFPKPSWLFLLSDVLFLLALDLAAIRVRARLHFVKDVVAGALIATALSAIYFI